MVFIDTLAYNKISTTPSNLQRSKSLAASVFKNNDLNLKMKQLARQSIQIINNIEQQGRTKHGNNSSKQNIDDDNEAASDENVILNKRQCSVNLDELKRCRSEDEQQKTFDINEPKPKTRKTSYMSKSLQDNSS